MSGQLYKILVDGRSCHGGDLVWSLPADGKAGDWHEVEGTIEVCKRGLHLTDDPVRWWMPGCRVYLVEAEGVVGSCDDSKDLKVAARRVRLLREATEAELETLRIFTSGSHKVVDARAVAYGNSRVVAYDNSRVVAYDNSTVKAYDSSTVEAWDSGTVEAYDNSTVWAYDNSSVWAYDNSTVKAYGNSTVEAWDSSTVEAYDNSSVEAYGNSRVVARGSSRVKAWDSSTVTAYDNSTVTGKDNVTIVSWKGTDEIKVTNQAVCIDRSGDKPRCVVAKAKGKR